MRDVVAADLVGDGTDPGGARHRVAAEEQVIAGADQAGIKQHRIDFAEFAGRDAFRQQAALEIQQRPDKEFRHFVGGLGAALMQQIMDQPVHVGKLVIGLDDAGDMQLQLRGRRDRLRQQIFEMGHLGGGVARQQRQQQPVLVAEMIFHQRGVDAGLLRDIAQRHIDRVALDHQFARGDQQPVGGGIFRWLQLGRGAGIQMRCHHGPTKTGPQLAHDTAALKS